MSEPRSPENVVIKKYGNRRLYDTRQSRYITLGELADIIRSGALVKVVDAKSGQDLTRQVLTQVILEEQERLDLLPVELLLTLIRVQGTLQQAPFAGLLQAVTRQFAEAGNAWMQGWAALLSNMPGAPAGAPAAPAPDAAGAQRPAGGDPFQELRERMDALLSRLGQKKG